MHHFGVLMLTLETGLRMTDMNRGNKNNGQDDNANYYAHVTLNVYGSGRAYLNVSVNGNCVGGESLNYCPQVQNVKGSKNAIGLPCSRVWADPKFDLIVDEALAQWHEEEGYREESRQMRAQQERQF